MKILTHRYYIVWIDDRQFKYHYCTISQTWQGGSRTDVKYGVYRNGTPFVTVKSTRAARRKIRQAIKEDARVMADAARLRVLTK